MIQSGVFSCPQCGASLQVHGDAPEVECPYCGNTIQVPESLRPHPSAPQQISNTTVILLQTPLQVAHQKPAAPQPTPLAPPRAPQPVVRPKRRFSPGACVLWLLAIFVVLPVLLAFVVYFVNPNAFDQFTKPSMGEVVHWFGGKASTPGQFEDAVNLAVDDSNNIYALEYRLGRVQQFSEIGMLHVTWTVGKYSQSIAADRAGNVFIGSGPQILKYDRASHEKTDEYTLPQPSAYVESMAVLPDGGLIASVADPNGGAGAGDFVRFNSALQEVGRMLSPVRGQTGKTEPLSLAVDSTGDLWALAKTSNMVMHFTSTGGFISSFGGTTAQKGQFDTQAYSLAIDSADRIFVSDEHSIHVYDRAGKYLGRVVMPELVGYAANLAFGPHDELYAFASSNYVVYEFKLRK